MWLILSIFLSIVVVVVVVVADQHQSAKNNLILALALDDLVWLSLCVCVCCTSFVPVYVDVGHCLRVFSLLVQATRRRRRRTLIVFGLKVEGNDKR